MNRSLKMSQYVKPTPMPESYIGTISGFDQAQKCWQIDHHFLAQVAESVLVKPEAGDVVSFIAYQDGFIIVQILQRANKGKMTLQSQDDVCWIAPKVSIQVQDELELMALNTVSITGNNLVQSAQESSVQQAQTMILHGKHLSANAEDVMNLSAKQHMLIAEEEVRIDGERINMG